MASEQTRRQNIERLMGFFERQDDEGLYVYSDEDVRHFLPLLVLTIATESDETSWSPATRKLMEGFTKSIELPADASVTQLSDAVQAYYKKHPIDKELQNNFQAVVRNIIATGADSAVGEAASKLLGLQPSTLQPKKPGIQRGESLLNMMLSGTGDKDEEEDG